MKKRFRVIHTGNGHQVEHDLNDLYLQGYTFLAVIDTGGAGSLLILECVQVSDIDMRLSMEVGVK